MRLIRIAAAALACACSSPILAADIDFAFNDGATVEFYGRTHIPGTVTGTLFGLQDNATSLPTSFRIATSPDALLLVEGTYFGNYYTSPGITLLNGKVVAANLFANFDDAAGNAFQLRLNCTAASVCDDPLAENLNHLIGNDGANNGGTGNQAGFGGATYGAVGSAPEPGSWALMILGFGVAGWTLRLRKQGQALAA